MIKTNRPGWIEVTLTATGGNVYKYTKVVFMSGTAKKSTGVIFIK